MADLFRCARAVTVAALLAAPVVARADAGFQRFRIDPHGRVAGLLLGDGTEIPASPAATAVLASSIHPGDSVRVTYGPTGEALLALQRTARFVDLGNANTPVGVTPADVSPQLPIPTARGGGPQIVAPFNPAVPTVPREAVPYSVIDDASGLARVNTQGRVSMVTHTQYGVPTGFVLDNGAEVSVAPSVAGMLEDVHPGDALRVVGRGTTTPQGTGLWAVSITSNHGVILDMNRGPGPVELHLPRGG